MRTHPLTANERRQRRHERARLSRLDRPPPQALPAKRCPCESPITFLDSDEDRWCITCGRMARPGT